MPTNCASCWTFFLVGTNELGRLVKELREAEKDLERLAAEQAGLQKKNTREAEKLPEAERRQELERLARQERKLQEEAERFSRKLERLQAEEASTSGQSCRADGAIGRQRHGGRSRRRLGTAEAAQQGPEEAQRELAAKRQQAESDFAQEQLARIEDAIKSVQERQEKLTFANR